ncbi:ABC transporter ATP-binding protein [Natronococcus occultus]|uniref:ABC-type antimicrobial peptide transport system, ATPase component n=1 Tax=Natronococcus occultus SP4 TaxID=694430 RepID=L0JU06_9EURY|nr:ABC transporter ATP-binding protein [Natronococcus occultus]AGB36236.1 ABC-type antimicrobial peptide transport system, ATPase component [Natronococcus occultus SP4]
MVAHDTGPGAAAVTAESVRRTYQLAEPVHAVDSVSLSLGEGSFTAVMGPSGSGKSTLMNLVGCLDTPDEGRIEVGGRSVGELSDTERARLRGTEIGFVFQTVNLLPRLTAVENVRLPMVFHDGTEADRDGRARALLERVGLGDRLGHEPSELSGGQRQRVALALALANEPTLVLADEPTGNLDTETEVEIMELLVDLNEAGATILLVTHERAVAEYADHVVHLLDGEIEDLEHLSDAREVTARERATGGAGNRRSMGEGEA